MPSFDDYYHGTLYGILRWDQLSAFWQTIQADQPENSGWYVYAVGEPVPEAPVSAALLERFIHETDALLHRDHREEYCGIVYADDLKHPNFVKIFDPHKLGSSCGSSKNPPPPGWILSRVPPQAIVTNDILPQQRKRWFASIFGG